MVDSNDGMRLHVSSSAIVLAVVVGLSGAPPRAQQAGNVPDRVEEIVVSATKVGEQSLSDVPMAIQAFSGESLETKGIREARDLIELIPGASEQSEIGAGYKVFSFRGSGAGPLAMVQRARAERVALPGAIAPGTPWSDLSKTGDTYFTNESLDNALGGYEPLLSAAAKLYANGIDLKDPRLSPVYGDFTGFPPTILTTGTRDLFLSNTVRVHRKLRAAGVEAQLEVYEGQSHAQYIPDPSAPETKEAFGQITRFFDLHLAR